MKCCAELHFTSRDRRFQSQSQWVVFSQVTSQHFPAQGQAERSRSGLIRSSSHCSLFFRFLTPSSLSVHDYSQKCDLYQFSFTHQPESHYGSSQFILPHDFPTEDSLHWQTPSRKKKPQQIIQLASTHSA